jgi:hypothetical protein
MQKMLIAVLLSTPLTLTLARATGAQPPPRRQNDYRGHIDFTWEVKGPAGSMKRHWTATVNATSVDCLGAEDATSQGQTNHTDLHGPGLLQIRFESEQEYSFEVACPSPEHPTESSWTDMERSETQRGKQGETLKGSWDTPSDDDPANNQTGHKAMSWNLCYKASAC